MKPDVPQSSCKCKGRVRSPPWIPRTTRRLVFREPYNSLVLQIWRVVSLGPRFREVRRQQAKTSCLARLQLLDRLPTPDSHVLQTDLAVRRICGTVGHWIRKPLTVRVCRVHSVRESQIPCTLVVSVPKGFSLRHGIGDGGFGRGLPIHV